MPLVSGIGGTGKSALIERLRRDLGRGDKVVLGHFDLDRAALRKRIFEVPEERRWLEALLHPLIAEEIARHLALAKSPYAILVSPLLIESGQYAMTQRVLVIDAPEQLQIERTLLRDQTSEQQVQAILKAQSSRQDRLRHANDVVVNDRDLAWLHSEVERLHHFYLTLRGGQS